MLAPFKLILFFSLFAVSLQRLRNPTLDLESLSPTFHTDAGQNLASYGSSSLHIQIACFNVLLNAKEAPENNPHSCSFNYVFNNVFSVTCLNIFQFLPNSKPMITKEAQSRTLFWSLKVWTQHSSRARLPWILLASGASGVHLLTTINLSFETRSL